MVRLDTPALEPVVKVPVTKLDAPPPPLFVPVVCTPLEVKNIFPLATSLAVAVVGVTSVKDAFPPPLFGNRTDGTFE